MLSAADIAACQAQLALIRTTPCVIQRKTLVSDGAGGNTETWATLSSPLCRVSPKRLTEREDVMESRLQAVSMWRIALPVGTDVTPKDRIVALGITYEVANAGPRTIDLELIVYCDRVQS